MRTTVLGNEFRKMRHLHVGLLAVAWLVAVTTTSVCTSFISPDFDRTTEASWNTLLGGAASGIALITPLLLAVVASRQVDVEHRGNGWLLSATSGVTPGLLCRAKFAALGGIVAAATATASGVIAATGFLVGITASFPATRWIGFTAAVVVVNLVLVALHIGLSARFENQLIGLGVGLLGTVVAVFAGAAPAGFAHVTPWGYYSLSAASGYVDAHLVALTPSYPSIAVLGLVAASVFWNFTRRFEGQGV